MAPNALRRLGGALLLAVAISLVAFLLARALPGDPAEVILGLRADPALLAHVRAELGIDRPWPVQDLQWPATPSGATSACRSPPQEPRRA